MKKIDEIRGKVEKDFVYKTLGNHFSQNIIDTVWQICCFIKIHDNVALTDEAVWSIARNIRQALTDYKEEILKLITEEIAQAHLEGDKTSRLTSLFNKIQTK